MKARRGTYQASLEPLASITCERIVTLPPVGLDRYVEGLNDARTLLAAFFSILLYDLTILHMHDPVGLCRQLVVVGDDHEGRSAALVQFTHHRKERLARMRI